MIHVRCMIFHCLNLIENTCIYEKYIFPGNINCPVASFESYISKLNQKCEALWQRPNDFVYESGTIWYNKSPVGKHLLGSMMTNISKRSQLSRHYTNHSIRATSITIMDESGLESRHIMKVSGHKSEASLKSYAQNIPNKKKIERMLIKFTWSERCWFKH